MSIKAGKAEDAVSDQVMTVEPQKAEGRLWTLWAAFAKAFMACSSSCVYAPSDISVRMFAVL